VDLQLAGKVALVTGAGRGIGLAVTRALAEEGVRVAGGARDVSGELSKLAATSTVHPVSVDLAVGDGPSRLVAETIDTYGDLHILVNNVGAMRTRVGGFLGIADDEWASMIAINLLAAVRTTRAALPSLLDRGDGSIVNIASIHSFLPDPLVMDFGAAKAALVNFSKALAREVGPRGIRVNTISPGPVATEQWLGSDGVAATIARATGAQPYDVADRVAKQAITGRFTQPAEVAYLVLMLASSRTGNITGADFVIDGGLTAAR
jgi:NAD(P)-dependent dehydrogenase (short-subunit alcohol dehydrogenase family)